MEKQIYMNRELSWLKFNERVLEEAESDETPLCERLTFASIYQSNLDEFFMVRVGALIDQMMLPKEITENKTNMTSKEQINEILTQVAKLNYRKDIVYETLMKMVEEHGIRLVNFRKIDKEKGEYLERYFDAEILPMLSATIVGKRQPFPFLRNKEIYAAAVLTRKNGKEKIGLIPCTSGVFRRLIPVPGGEGTFMLSEELILHFMAKAFPGYTIKEKSLIRVTRNADIDADALYDEDLDYRDFMADLIKRRKHLAPVKMELSREFDGEVVKQLCEYLDMKPDYVFRSNTPLDLSFFFQIQDMLRQNTGLFYNRRVPQKSSSFEKETDILAQIKEKDRLLSYPYESIKPFLQMLREAANDPKVVSMKMTLYRVASHSKVVEALIEAAENGKDVLVLVELKARFDEENNIGWSRALEEAGCHVIYGLEGYKVHSKLCLITRKEDDQIQYYTQVGTGNYNEKTARLYTDLCLMTADTAIGQEAAAVFAALARGETIDQTEQLLVAPNCLQNRILSMIDEEIEKVKNGKPGYIGIKINSLTDKKIIDQLIAASQAGVKIDLIVRGICCLIPGVQGKTENIRVISIVGRFLEHSRIYLFGEGEEQKIYIASADFMTRNTLRRVEVAAPVKDEDIKRRLQEMFRIMLEDNRQARYMDTEGNYHHVINDKRRMNSQEYFYEQAYQIFT